LPMTATFDMHLLLAWSVIETALRLHFTTVARTPRDGTTWAARWA